MYTVKELFPTLQGEGAHAGRAAVFCRFAGCNLWSGREEDRPRRPGPGDEPEIHGRDLGNEEEKSALQAPTG